MHEIEKDSLIDFFKKIDEEFEYVVLRNAAELPFENFSNDIDILIDKSKYSFFDQVMKRIFLAHGFERLERTSFHGIECYTFYNIQNTRPYSLKIDLFFGIEGGGVRYFEHNDVLRYRTKNSHGVYILDTKVESYLTALKTFAAGGKLKENYLKNFLENPLDVDHNLVTKCPSATLRKYLEHTAKTHKSPELISRRKIIFETIQETFKISPYSTICRMIYHCKIELLRMFKKRYMIVLVGPDGSGKTTLIERIKQDSKNNFRSLPERFEVFHHRPHIFPNISQIFKKNLNEQESYDLNFNPHSAKQSNYFISFFKLQYYVFDYICGYIIKIMPLQRKNKFIIFDRYYYDFIVDQKRSALYVPKNIAIAIFKIFIPKPNKIFFIEVDPQEAYDRKQELPTQMIASLNGQYKTLSRQLENFVVIPNEDLDKAYSEFLKNFILTITESVDS